MLDPTYYKNVDVNNSNRLIRALELIELTGKKYYLQLFKTNFTSRISGYLYRKQWKEKTESQEKN